LTDNTISSTHSAGRLTCLFRDMWCICLSGTMLSWYKLNTQIFTAVVHDEKAPAAHRWEAAVWFSISVFMKLPQKHHDWVRNKHKHLHQHFIVSSSDISVLSHHFLFPTSLLLDTTAKQCENNM
jgi:hypothetical protein